tara:strand:- start:1516 stop:2982 length:1467 start_codon:yes stop_codon:yes gene_type:complete
MPTAIGTAILTAVGSALVKSAVATFIVGAVVIVGTVALATRALTRKQSQRQRSTGGTLVTKSGTSVSIPVVYGKRRMGGHRSHISSDGTDNVNLHLVESLCEGPIEHLEKVFFNDELVATSTQSSGSNANANWNYESKYNSTVEIYFYDGSQTAEAGQTIPGFNDSDNTRVGNKVAYVYLKLTWDEDVYGSGAPNITYTIKGKKVPAIGGVESNDAGASLTYSSNPARCIYDYLTNSLYGKSIPKDLLDTTTFNNAKTYSDETVAKTASDATAVTRYECNAYIDTQQSVLNNVEELLTTCRAGLITGDKYKLIVDEPVSASGVAINDDNIIGDINYLQANKKTLLNSLRVTFPNEDSTFNFQEDVVTVQSTTLQNSSNDNIVLKQDMELPNTTNKEMVQRIATEEINQSRQSGIVEVEVDPSLINLTVGDVVTFTNTTLGQTNKTYRILQTVIKPDHRIGLNMREYDTNVYWDNNKNIITNNKDDTDH